MDIEATDRDMQRKIDSWYEDAISSLENAEITELAYEVRDLEDTSAALTDLADELADMGHLKVAGYVDVAARAVTLAAEKIGEIDG